MNPFWPSSQKTKIQFVKQFRRSKKIPPILQRLTETVRWGASGAPVEAKEYGSCVATRVPEIERDMCAKEFLALKSCMQNVLKKKV
ncbi:hypothetical protein K1719_040752 [Acacia pycnantha]|nr:hypothetical protein K1719_040752 [Acacia pycnantha]